MHTRANLNFNFKAEKPGRIAGDGGMAMGKQDRATACERRSYRPVCYRAPGSHASGPTEARTSAVSRCCQRPRAMPNHGGSLRLSGGLGGSTGGSPTGRVDSDLAHTVRTQAPSSLRLARQRLKRTQASEGGPVAACASTILEQMMIF